jgi:peptide/nickel transport system permease protein
MTAHNAPSGTPSDEAPDAVAPAVAPADPTTAKDSAMTTDARPAESPSGPTPQASPSRPARTAPPAARTKRRRYAHVVALAWIGLVVLLALLANVLPLPDPAVDRGHGASGPFRDWADVLGTDRLGRSQLSRLIFGARVSLAVGTASAVLGMIIGGAIGVLAGYSRRKFDAVVGILTDSFLAFPALILLIALTAVLSPSIPTLIIGLSLVSLPSFIRLTRANTLRFVNREFVLAARAVGAKPGRIVLRELVPNVIAPVAAYLPLVTATLIIAESSLSFLGLGIRPPTPSWGTMIADGQESLRTRPFLVFVPAAILFITVFAINTIGEWLRSRFDSRQSKL